MKTPRTSMTCFQGCHVTLIVLAIVFCVVNSLPKDFHPFGVSDHS